MEITDRLIYIMKLNNLSQSAFADKINVQRSSISHLLSGRNKPGLDIIQKVLMAFPKVNTEWLITGKTTTEPLSSNTIEPTTQKIEDKNTSTLPHSTSKTIQKIVVFYSDNTFEEFYK